MNPSPHARHRAGALFALLAALYFFTFNGYPVSTDELLLYDGARSFVRDGTFELAFTNELTNYATPPDGQIMPELGAERMAVYLSAPLIWLAERIPGMGLMHAAWLLNVLLTALTGVIFYGYAQTLGYAERTAWFGALILGGATILLPYAGLYFREPALTCFGLLAAYCAERFRQAVDTRARLPRIAGWMTAMLAAYGAAAISKNAGFLLMPALVVIAFPDRMTARVARLGVRALILGGLAMLVAGIGGAALLFLRNPDLLARLTGGQFIQDFLAYAPEAGAAYLFSPGLSVWAFSPILLAGFAGLIRVLRARRWRQTLVPLIVLLVMTGGYATINGAYWYGGLGWGPRFLVPAVPFLALWLLPILDRFGALRFGPKLLFGGLLALSIGIQALGALYPITTFSRVLAEESEKQGLEIVAWREGVWDVRYLPQVITAREAPDVQPAPAWSHVHSGAPAALAAMTLLVAAARFWPYRRWFLLAGTALMLGVGLRAYAPDPRYGGDNPALIQALDTIEAGLRPDDAIILENRTYRLFFMNYFRHEHPIYALPYARGERQNPADVPLVVSDHPDERAEPAFQIIFARLATRSARWWYVTEYTPFSTDRLRVTEHFLARHYFPAEEPFRAPGVRLITFAPISAPPDDVLPWPAYPLEADFGAATLIGMDLPRGSTFSAAQVRDGLLLPVSLVWRHDGFAAGIEPFDYSVNLSLIDSSGAARAQRAGAPMGTFGAMSLWQVGGFYRDNHALTLPADLAPGEYALWALIFDWRTSDLLPLRGAGMGDHAVIATITITD